jgi:hypothetical protein
MLQQVRLAEQRERDTMQPRPITATLHMHVDAIPIHPAMECLPGEGHRFVEGGVS